MGAVGRQDQYQTSGDMILVSHKTYIALFSNTEVNCLPLQAPANGTMTYIHPTPTANALSLFYGLNSIAEFRCNEGFEIEGEVSLVCTQYGHWSGEPPTCVPTDCHGKKS